MDRGRPVEPAHDRIRSSAEGAPIRSSSTAVRPRSRTCEVGETITIGTPIGARQVRVVGISRFGDDDSVDDGGSFSFDEASIQTLLNPDTPGYDQILVRTSGDPAAVESSLRSTLPKSLSVVSGDSFRADQRQSASGFVDALSPALQAFAYLALFVAGFVIFNTFSVVVTQRFRELALIRAVGGTPGQVRRSLLFEGATVGLLSSAIGVVAGMGLALLLQWILGLFGVDLPGAGVKLTPGTVILCLVAGTVITVLSVAVPAFRAGRTKPVEAMRDSAVDESGSSRIRLGIGAVALVVSLALLLYDRLVSSKWQILLPGALLLFIGIVVGGPLLARLFARLVLPVMRRLGVTGRLAADNAIRNPKRTATTANALVIGLFLVTLVTVSGNALKSWTVDELNKLSSADFLVTGEKASISPQLAEQIANTRGVKASAPVRTAPVPTADNHVLIVSTGDPTQLRESSGFQVKQGSAATIADGAGAAVIDAVRGRPRRGSGWRRRRRASSRTGWGTRSRSSAPTAHRSR